MEIIRIGDKVLNIEKIEKLIRRIISMRASGSTQSEVAEALGIDRSFISHLEGLGEVRKGIRVALVAFPVANKKELEKLAEESGVDFVFVLSQEERVELVEKAEGAYVFNEVMDILAELVEYDVIIILASDMRIRQAEKIFGAKKVVGIEIGESPIRKDVHVDIEKLRPLLKDVIQQRKGGKNETRGKRKFRFFKKKSRSRD